MPKVGNHVQRAVYAPIPDGAADHLLFHNGVARVQPGVEYPHVPVDSVVGELPHGIPIAAVRDRPGGEPFLAAIKSRDLGGANEILNSFIGRQAGMSGMVGDVRRLPDGSSAIPLLSGPTAAQVGAEDGHALLGIMQRHFEQTMDAPAATDAAMQRLERMHAFDATIGNLDRNGSNIVVLTDQHPSAHTLAEVSGDIGLLDQATVRGDLVPRAKLPRTAGGLVLPRLQRTYVENGPIPYERVGQHYEMPIHRAVADDIGRVTEAAVKREIQRAIENAPTNGVHGISEFRLADTVRLASWISEHARIPFVL